MKVLPSDFAVACLRKWLVESSRSSSSYNYYSLSYLSTPIPVKITLSKSRPYESRAVITGIPLKVTDGELMEDQSDYGLTFVKRLRKKIKNGFLQSLSYLLCL